MSEDKGREVNFLIFALIIIATVLVICVLFCSGLLYSDTLFRTVFPPGFSAHQKHYHADIEEVIFGIRGRGVVGIEHPDGKIEDYEVSPGVAIFIPKSYIHWFRNLNPDEEVEICGVYSAPDAGDYKPEDYVYIGEITEDDKKLR